MTLASRFGGLIRDVMVGRIFGDNPALNSAFQAAFSIPNLFRRLFGEGALSAAFLPIYTRTHKTEPDKAHALASLTMVVLAGVTLAITLLVEVILLAVLQLGQHSPERRLLLQLVMVMLPFMPLICMVAIAAGMLQVHGRFAAAASGPIILNGFIIAVGGYYILTDDQADTRIAFTLGVATVLSAATQLFWFLRLLRRTGQVRWTRELAPARAEARDMARKFGPVAIGLGTLQLNTFLDTAIATFPLWFDTARKGIAFPLDEASNAIIALTSRLYQFPLGVFGIAIASAAFPLLARHADDPGRFLDTLRRGLRLSLFIGLPATLGLALVRHDLVAVLYGYGRESFDASNLLRSAAVLLGFAPGVWAYSLNHVFTRAFYARGDTRTPMNVSILCMLINIGLNLSLIWALSEAGMALATSLAAMLQCAMLATLARKRLVKGPLLDREAISAGGRIIIASAIMAAAVYLTQHLFFSPRGTTWRAQLLSLTVCCGVGTGTYLAAAVALRITELRQLASRRST